MNLRCSVVDRMVERLRQTKVGEDAPRPGEPMLLNFQNRDGYVPPYQARQLIAMIEKYGDDQ